MNTNTPPQAKRVPHTHEIHGDVREDPYYWLRERDNPDVVAYLEAENAYLKAAGPSQALQDALYQEMFGRIQQVDLSVPVKDGPYWYGSRTVEGQQYKVYYRKRAESRAALEQATEEVLLDLNALAAQHAFLKLSILQVTPDHRILAYSLDTDGSANNTFYFKDLETGEVLPDQLTNTESYGSLVWAADSRTVFYLQMDQTHRPYALMRHTLGTDPNTDECLYREQDDSYVLFLNRSQDREYLFLNCSSKLTTEQHWLRSEDPNGQWQVFAPRQHNILYHLEHAQGRFLVHTNENAINFKLMGAPVGNTTAQNASREGWETIIEHRESVLLEGVQPFANHWLVPVREGGLARVWVRDRDGQTRALEFDEPVSTVHIADNREFDTNEFNVLFDSMSTPYTIWGFRFDTLERTLLKREVVADGYDTSQLESRRLWATAPDGTQVPISLVAKRGVLEAGPAPTLLYGYGSYGYGMDPAFDVNRICLLERGVVFAIAHVRGGNEMGRPWYENGKLMHKRNTFTDFIACAKHLIDQGITSSPRLAVMGGSAGGLLMGAITNMRPELFHAVVAQVPFVDVMTTMLDASIPLTAQEWDEWGNPRDPAFYAYMRSYSPYDNVEAKAYPHLLVTTGLNDPRVAYWEPAKWVARLRTLKTDRNDLFLYTNMGAGHGGASGRFDRLREIALEFAFVLERITNTSA